MLGSHNNEKQCGGSVGGYSRPGAEILIKASWHLKSSVIRQSIWVKRAFFSGRPTSGPPQRGAGLQLTRPLANQDTSPQDVIRNTSRWGRQTVRSGFTEGPVCTLHVLFAWMSSALARLAQPSQSPARRPLPGWSYRATLAKERCPCGKGALRA